MNFKKIGLILSFLYLNSKVLSGPLSTDAVDSSIESDDENIEFPVEDIISDGNGTETVDIFEDEEINPTEVINTNVEECLTEECIETASRILSNMDISVDPCDNFYQFACGGWEVERLKQEIDYENQDPVHILRDLQGKVNETIVEYLQGEYNFNENLSEDEQEYSEKTFNKLKSIYGICMKYEFNTDTKNEVLKNYIDNLNLYENKENLKDPKVFTDFILKLHKKGINTFGGIQLIDDKTIYEKPLILLFYNEDIFGGPSFIAHAKNIPESVPIYKEYVNQTLKLFYGNETYIEPLTETIMNIELKLGEIYLNDIFEKYMYNSMSRPKDDELIKKKDLNRLYPFIDWDVYLKERLGFYGMEEYLDEDILMYDYNTNLYKDLTNLLNDIDVDDLIEYIKWVVISCGLFDEIISEDFVNVKYEALIKIMNMINDFIYKNGLNALFPKNEEKEFSKEEEEEMKNNLFSLNFSNNRLLNYDHDESIYFITEKEKSQYCVDVLDALMPMALSRLFIQKTFVDNIRVEAQQMIDNIREAMLNRIPKMEWLDEETKQYAITKVLKMKDRIGFPSDIMNIKKYYQEYEKININDYIDIILSLRFIYSGISLKPEDKDQWKLTPYTVNAYYDVSYNSINFPAGILMPPFFSASGQDYINYGGVGSIMGHELTHAFDNKGRLYDTDGKRNNWWTQNDSEEFTEFSQCFIDQYNSYTYKIKDILVNVNGKNTLGENLADNGGLARAYDAWQLSLLKNPERAIERNKKLPGFENYTLDQLFYIAFGQSQCYIPTYKTFVNVHSPGIARINGVVSNSVHFSKTFNCPPKSSMNPEQKCLIW